MSWKHKKVMDRLALTEKTITVGRKKKLSHNRSRVLRSHSESGPFVEGIQFRLEEREIKHCGPGNPQKEGKAASADKGLWGGKDLLRIFLEGFMLMGGRGRGQEKRRQRLAGGLTAGELQCYTR